MKFPERFINAHYFNPSHIVPLVELTGNEKTSQDILEKVYDFYTDLGKKPVIVKKEITGFIVNRLQFALLREACNLVDEGVANANDIDEAIRASFIPRVAVAGIFQVFDLTGWDLMAKVWQQIVPTLSNQTELPDCILQKLKSNELGVKTGNGFYNWDDNKVLEIKTKIIQSLLDYKNN
jgi:3-hydroxybutyryl-CoA dehydrogenase